MPKWPKITWKYSINSHKYSPNILGINPWIYDFAAYNLWSRPAGLLACLNSLKQHGAKVALLDCLDQTWSDIAWPKIQKYGRGHYPKTVLPKPACLSHIPRRYSRYGLPYNLVYEALKLLSPPDLVLITSIMTYWYPGVVAASNLVKKLWPKVPVVVGGIYTTLCYEHAQGILNNVDLIIKGPLEKNNNWQQIWNLLGYSTPSLNAHNKDFSLALDLYPSPSFSIILGSRGCPFSCAYCASNQLYPEFCQRSFSSLWSEIKAELDKDIQDFAFYDDALLVNPSKWLLPLLQKIIDLKYKIRLHTPNALHVRYLDEFICQLFKKAGLTTIRLGLETANFKNRLDAKITFEEWKHGLAKLFEAGFKAEQIGAYILFGLPQQTKEEIEQAINFVHQSGIRPYLAYYSPIPGSKLFPEAEKTSPYPLAEEPLFQNSSIWPCYLESFSWNEQQKWKKMLQSSTY